MAFRTKYENIWLNTHTLQLLHRVLRGFRLQLVGSFQVRHISKVHAHRITSQLPPQLTYGLHKRRTLDVANGTADFANNEIKQTLLRPLPVMEGRK